MAQDMTNPCSPYLLRPIRSLRTACVQLQRRRAVAAPPCGSCAI